jgi:hypothetical protein
LLRIFIHEGETSPFRLCVTTPYADELPTLAIAKKKYFGGETAKFLGI